MRTNKQRILEFLQQNTLAVLSTVGLQNDQPESALIAFAETSELELIFETQSNTRKYQNLQENPKVSLVIGWDPICQITLQYEGIATELFGNELGKCVGIFRAKKTPCPEEYLAQSNVNFFKISPTWIGFSDYTDKKPQVRELFF